MLDENYLQRLNSVLETVPCQVKLPRSLFEQLSQTGVVQSMHEDNRQFVRKRIFDKAVLQVWHSIPSVERKPEFFSIFTKDMGLRSVGFYHSQQLYPGEHHFIFLSSGKKECTVRRCYRHNELCYEIGSTIKDGDE